MRTARPFFADWAFWGLILAALIFSAGGHLVRGDEETMFQVTQSLLRGQGVAISRDEIVLPVQNHPTFLPIEAETVWTTSAVPGRDGKEYSKYGLGQSIIVIPLYFVGTFFEQIASNDQAFWPDGWYIRLWVSFLNPLALAGIGWLLMKTSSVLEYKVATGRWLAVAAIFSTMLWPYVKTFYPQPSVTFLLLLCFYAALQWKQTSQERWLWTMAIASGLGILFRLSFMVVLVPVCGYLTWSVSPTLRWKWIKPQSVGLGIGVGITAAYNWLRFGSLFETGYHEVAWTNPPIVGLYGLLFSPGKGILFYAPMLILLIVAGRVFSQKYRSELFLIYGLWGVLLAFYAPYNFWTGGFNWGPRFLMPIIPLSFLPLGVLLENIEMKGSKLIFHIFFLVGLIIQIPAIIVDHSRYLFQQFSEQDTTSAYGRTILEMEYSPVVRQWPTAIDLLKAYSQPDTWEQAKFALEKIGAEFPTEANISALVVSDFLRMNTIDFWWLGGHYDS